MRLGIALAAIAACATGLPARAAEPAHWRGLYLGLSVGAAGSAGNLAYADYPSGTFASTFGSGIIPQQQASHSVGFQAGVLAGYNWQSGPLVLGLEADYSPSKLQASTTYSYPCGCGQWTTVASQSLGWLATLRGKLGVIPMDGVMVFGTAGLAIGHVERRFNSADDSGLFSIAGESSGVRTGLVYGGGGEYALTGSLTARLEYLHYDLGADNITAPYTVMGVDSGTGLIGRYRVGGDIVRAALTYRFQ